MTYRQKKALVFNHNKFQYDIILENDFLTKSGITILYSIGTTEWFENVLPIREPHKANNSEYLAMADAYIIQIEEKLGEDWLDSCATTEILDARYERKPQPGRERSNTLK